MRMKPVIQLEGGQLLNTHMYAYTYPHMQYRCLIAIAIYRSTVTGISFCLVDGWISVTLRCVALRCRVALLCCVAVLRCVPGIGRNGSERTDRLDVGRKVTD